MTVPAYRAGAAPQPHPDGHDHDPRAAVDDLFRRHAPGLVRFALMLVGDQATAEDVVQEAFIGLVHRSHVRAGLLRVPHDPPVWSAEAAAMNGEDRRAVLAAIARLRDHQPTPPPRRGRWQRATPWGMSHRSFTGRIL
jgi:hypothetical protein